MVRATISCCIRGTKSWRFKVLQTVVKDLPSEGIKKDACVFNRGVFVVDVPRWQSLGITQDIEMYMKAYAMSKKDLYHFGMSQPPWLLAVRGRYRRLDLHWNCRGLGRDMMSGKEFKLVLAHIPEDVLIAAKVNKLNETKIYRKPFISACAGTARLLHYNGALKPWKRNTMRTDHPGKSGSLCAISRKQISDMKLVKCHDVWKLYLSNAAEKALQG